MKDVRLERKRMRDSEGGFDMTERTEMEADGIFFTNRIKNGFFKVKNISLVQSLGMPCLI